MFRRSKTLATHESGLATVTVNGREYGFRPTMHDDAGMRMTITIFDMGSPSEIVKGSRDGRCEGRRTCRLLEDVASLQVEREMARSLERIRDAVAPYSRFVRAERDRLVSVRDDLAGIKEALDTIRVRIESSGQ